MGTTRERALRAGEVVEVLSKEEILATLDETGRLDAMPFMPEMLQYCGKRFQVYKQAHKTCDNIEPWNMRRVKHAVHLTGVRCDGQAHGNCDAGCLIFWHEAWLKRVETELLKVQEVGDGSLLHRTPAVDQASKTALCTTESLQRATRKGADPVSGEDIFACQATDLRKFSTNLPWWNIWHYVRDIHSGNLRRGLGGDSKSELFMEALLGWLDVVRAVLIEAVNNIQAYRKGVQYPHIEGALVTTTATELQLRPGEFVQVKSKEEIFSTLDQRSRNRGLLFDSEMLRYCGGTYRVLKRVNQIVDEKTGKTLRMKSPCIILEGSACVAEYHRLCPRAIYHYWREGWLRRV
jgi:hypothetical protein